MEKRFFIFTSHGYNDEYKEKTVSKPFLPFLHNQFLKYLFKKWLDPPWRSCHWSWRQERLGKAQRRERERASDKDVSQKTLCRGVLVMSIWGGDPVPDPGHTEEIISQAGWEGAEKRRKCSQGSSVQPWMYNVALQLYNLHHITTWNSLIFTTGILKAKLSASFNLWQRKHTACHSRNL